ncbi:MAG: peptide deformylase [Verrucomicrobia bacterium]|nr:peptide deformylase [Verrucomicrobiota bacterium]
MILPVVKYGHPVLRQRGKRIEAVTPEIRELAANMLETMRASAGVGLAAQQVGQPLLLMVLDTRESERPSTMQVNGAEADIAAHMPMVLLNPLLTEPAGKEVGFEGCLSFPGISADICRAESVTVSAVNIEGEPLKFRCGGLLARVIQHENDHLHGVLFIDRMDSATKVSLGGALKRLQKETQADLPPVRKRGARGLVASRQA